MNLNDYREVFKKAKNIFSRFRPQVCPALNNKLIIFNSNGFNHLRYHVNGIPRPIREQISKMNLLPLVISVIKMANSVEDYRVRRSPIGSKRSNGVDNYKDIEYWSIVSSVGKRQIKVGVIIRKIGNGKLHFWSVMRT